MAHSGGGRGFRLDCSTPTAEEVKADLQAGQFCALATHSVDVNRATPSARCDLACLFRRFLECLVSVLLQIEFLFVCPTGFVLLSSRLHSLQIRLSLP